ncbi:MAG: prepilin-type N-terminal cleavage/methylation domain-containing protein, partial [Candidatus Aminicenantes bacterium]
MRKLAYISTATKRKKGGDGFTLIEVLITIVTL